MKLIYASLACFLSSGVAGQTCGVLKTQYKMSKCCKSTPEAPVMGLYGADTTCESTKTMYKDNACCGMPTKQASPMLLLGFVNVNDGIDYSEAFASQTTVAATAQMITGFKRDTYGYDDTGRGAVVVEVFDTATTYFTFLGGANFTEIGRTTSFGTMYLQGSSAQIASLGSLPTDFGMQVYLTDGLEKLHDFSAEKHVPLLEPASGPMVFVGIIGLAEGVTKEQAMEVQDMIMANAHSVPGFKRDMYSWSMDGTTSMVVEIFDDVDAYQAFMAGYPDIAFSTFSFPGPFVLQGTTAQLATMKPYIDAFGMATYATDGAAGFNTL